MSTGQLRTFSTSIVSRRIHSNAPRSQLRRINNITTSSCNSRRTNPQPDQPITTEEPPKLSHLTEAGEAHMISISHKLPTFRRATAVATLLFSKDTTHAALDAATNKKGDAIAVARIAAIQAAKKTADLIPLAHPSLGITGITVDIDAFQADEKRYELIKYESAYDGQTEDLQEVSSLDARYGGVQVKVTVACEGKTGVEMEALMASTTGAMTLYDMLKGVDKAMVVTGCRVIKKEGGKSGGWEWNEQTHQIAKST